MTGSLRPLWRAVREPLLLGAALLVCLVFLVHQARGWGDTMLYRSYAMDFWAGPRAFHALPAEYPPLSIAVFTLTLVPAVEDYATVFAVWMGAAFAGGYLLFLRFSGHRRAVLFATYLLLGGAATLLGRFDILPALAVMGALWAVQRRRWRLTYLLLAVGALLKLYPLLLLPIFLAFHNRDLRQRTLLGTRRRTDLVLAALAPSLAVLVGAYITAGALDVIGTVSPFWYAAARPLQVESVPATVLWLLSFAGSPAESERAFHSFNLIGPLGPPIGSFFSVLMVVGLGYVTWAVHRGRLGLARACLAAVCVIVGTGKVFSPQYLIWVLPLVAESEDLDWRWVAICVLTALIYPIFYFADAVLTAPGPYPYSGDFLFLIALRNIVFAAATLRLLVPMRLPRPVVEGPAVSPVGD